MKKWIIIAIGSALLVSSQCVARQSYLQKESEALQKRIDQRKREEKRYADRIVNNAKLQTARKRSKREDDALAIADHQAEREQQSAYRAEVRHFTQLTQELATPTYAERPILDIIHEAEFTLQKIASYNPKNFHRYQDQLERALKRGKHPMSKDGKILYSNSDLVARQSVESLVDYTHNAQEHVEQTAAYAQEVAQEMDRILEEHRNAIVAFNEHMNAQCDKSQQRMDSFNVQLTRLNDALKKSELEAAQKEMEATNLAQCIDTFNTVSSKLSQNRISETEKTIENLEKRAHEAEQRTTILMLRLQSAHNSLSALEKSMPQRTGTEVAR